MRFAKAHGLGNDFILVEAAACPPDAARWARRLCDRHQGIGGDGVLVYRVGADAVEMRLLNADGSDAEISGNGLRCLAAYVAHGGRLPWSHVVVTGAGPRAVEVTALGPTLFRVTTDLGAPRLGSGDVPALLDPPRPEMRDVPLAVPGGEVRVTAMSLGNPHCAVLLDAPADDALLGRLGPALERHPVFPQRTNVELVAVTGPDEVRARFWERGVGPTRASGTGAASAAVAAMLSGRVGRRVRVACDGGMLEVEWTDGGTLRQTGEVELLFEGVWLAG